MEKKKICWPVLLYIGGYHLFLLIALPLYFLSNPFSWGLFFWTLGLVFISGTAITAGYHRLYSHSSYKTHPVIETILLFFGSMAAQGSAIQWSYDHRLHHAFVDQDKDPYSIKKGFWHAHMLWLFFRDQKADPKVVSDLWRKKLLRFQHEHYVFCMIASSAIAFLFTGWLFGNWWGAFLFSWWVRTLLLHHTTWCINSLAHAWGSQSYSREHSAVDNYIISLLTYGEGYHNYHHTFAQDYRNGIRWYHFDPTKWLIWTLSKLGLASDLKTVNQYRIAKEMIEEDKSLLLEKLKDSFHDKKEHFAEAVSDICEALVEKLTQLQQLAQQYRSIPKTEAKGLLTEIKKTKKELKSRWKHWKTLLYSVEKMLKARDFYSQI